MGSWRRSFIVIVVGLVTWALAAGAPAYAGAEQGKRPTRIALPDGFRPEGIAIGGAPVAYVGSLADGDIYAADLRTGTGRVLIQGPGTPSTGMKVDYRDRLFVAGGTAGNARVVDTRTGEVLRQWDLGSGETFVNDVVLTQRMAWFTDSSHPVLYGVSLGRGGALGPDVVRLPLGGEWNQVPGSINANGIDTTPDGRALLVVNSATGQLFRVDPRTGAARPVDLGGAVLTNGDGLLRIGRILYVVQNQLNRVTKVLLDARGSTGRVADTYPGPGTADTADFDVPTTVASFGNRLYLPNARFGTPAAPDTKYWITAIRRF